VILDNTGGADSVMLNTRHILHDGTDDEDTP
jgi:hypothetical protein